MSDEDKKSENFNPMPLLPKSKTEFMMPPKCPLESVKFIQLFTKIYKESPFD